MGWNLATERLLLRRFTAADADWLAALHGNPAVMRYIDDGKPVPAGVVAAETLPAILREYDELPDGLGRFAASEKAAGRPIGWFGLRPPSSVGLTPASSLGLTPQSRVTAELGYRLFPADWGSGYATEGARALVQNAFAEMRLDRIVATTMIVNTASRRVLEKAGLSLVRTFFADWPTYIAGAEDGDVVYAASRHEWRATHSVQVRT